MRRSLLSSIFCSLSLILITSSYVFLYPFEITRIFGLLFFGILFSLGLIIPAIYYYNKEDRVKQDSRMFIANQPTGHTFSLIYAFCTIGLGIFFFEAFGPIVALLWIMSGIFGLLGFVVYKDNKKV